jgi:hypothetical protein
MQPTTTCTHAGANRTPRLERTNVVAVLGNMTVERIIQQQE